MKSSRASLLSSKNGGLLRSSHIPLGTFMQSRAGEVIECFHHDKGLVQEIEQLVSACAATKTFTADTFGEEGQWGERLAGSDPRTGKVC